MIGSKHEVAHMQSDFYRDKYRRILHGFFLSTVLMVLLILAIIYLILFKPSPNYYATTTEGKIIPMQVGGR